LANGVSAQQTIGTGFTVFTSTGGDVWRVELGSFREEIREASSGTSALHGRIPKARTGSADVAKK
jgi:hypothetical protein